MIGAGPPPFPPLVEPSRFDRHRAIAEATATPATPARPTLSPAAAEARARLPMLRESFAHGRGYQDGLAVWWDGIPTDERRLLLALVGLDDAEEAARRPWRQFLQADRDRMVAELKHIGRMVRGLQWF